METQAESGADRRGTFDRKIIQYQEVVFALLMGAIAILSRGNPAIFYPETLWTFAALAGFNLAYHFLLKRRHEVWFIPMISIAVNLCVITAILRYTGGYDSAFWPMYLLPIFTACLYLERRHVALALASSVAFLACFYLEALWERSLWQSLEFFIKSGVLAFTAAVTIKAAFRERLVWRALRKDRAEIDRLAEALGRQEKLDIEARKLQTLGQLVAGLLHNLNNPLTVIVGTTQLLLQEAPKGSLQREDLERIDSAARACGRLTANLLSAVRRDVLPMEEADVGDILRGALAHFDYQIKTRRLALRLDISPDLPRLKLRTASLQLALLDLLSRASELALEGGRLELRAAPEPDGIEIRIAFETAAGGERMKGLESCRESLSKSGSRFETRETAGGVECLIHLARNP